MRVFRTMQISLVSLGLVFSLTAQSSASPEWKTWAETPPMGWNSWDCYHGSILESHFRPIVDFMAKEMKPFGYEYVVIDMGWQHPGPEGWDGKTLTEIDLGYKGFKAGRWFPVMAMDAYGRFVPDETRFPSAADGRGFKPLADYTHAQGLKFGIHIMRGIPRQAVLDNLPIAGSQYSAADVAYPEDHCHWWNNYMFGIDATKPGAQDYYNSIFNLYAAWGVDFVKVDDAMVPKYRAGEIEMMRQAIDQCGRPMVLSLSCGESQISFAHHLADHANMWRISIDVWDRWEDVDRMFELAHAWSPFIGNGAWPDADMLPIGRLAVDRPQGKRGGTRHSKFSAVEQQTLMSLWCIMRSPLMWGGDPLTTRAEDLDVLRNPEVLAVNQQSVNNRQIHHGYGRGSRERIWSADLPESGDKVIGLFNLSDDSARLVFEFRYEELRGKYRIRDLWQRRDIGIHEKLLSVTLPAHGSALYRMTPVDDPDVIVQEPDLPFELDAARGRYTLRLGGMKLADLNLTINGWEALRGSRMRSPGRIEGRVPGLDAGIRAESGGTDRILLVMELHNPSDKPFELKSVVFTQGDLGGYAFKSTQSGALLVKKGEAAEWAVAFSDPVKHAKQLSVKKSKNQLIVKGDFRKHPIVILPDETVTLDTLVIGIK